jgi:hypothetical protein
METMNDTILFHRAPGDEQRTRIIQTMTEATHDDGGDTNDLVGHAAHAHSMTSRDVLEILGLDFAFGDVDTPDGPATLGFTMQLIPDGERACWRSECPHGSGDAPATQREDRAARVAAAWGYRMFRDNCPSNHYAVDNQHGASAGNDATCALAESTDLNDVVGWVLDGCDDDAKQQAWEYIEGGGSDDDWKREEQPGSQVQRRHLPPGPRRPDRRMVRRGYDLLGLCRVRPARRERRRIPGQRVCGPGHWPRRAGRVGDEGRPETQVDQGHRRRGRAIAAVHYVQGG